MGSPIFPKPIKPISSIFIPQLKFVRAQRRKNLVDFSRRDACVLRRCPRRRIVFIENNRPHTLVKIRQGPA